LTTRLRGWEDGSRTLQACIDAANPGEESEADSAPCLSIFDRAIRLAGAAILRGGMQ